MSNYTQERDPEYKKWIFIIDDPLNDSLSVYHSLIRVKHINFFIFQLERNRRTNILYYHGYLELDKPRTAYNIKVGDNNDRITFESRISSHFQSILNYITRDSNRIGKIWEWGIPSHYNEEMNDLDKELNNLKIIKIKHINNWKDDNIIELEDE